MADKKPNLILTADLDSTKVEKKIKEIKTEMEDLRKKSEKEAGTPFGGLDENELKRYDELESKLNTISSTINSTKATYGEWYKQLEKVNLEYNKAKENLLNINKIAQNSPMLYSALKPAADAENARLRLLDEQLKDLVLNAPKIDIVDADQESSDAEQVFNTIKRLYAEYQQLARKSIKTSDDTSKLSELQRNILTLASVYEKASGKKLEIGGLLELEENKDGVEELSVEIKTLYNELTKLEKKKIIDDTEKARIDTIKKSISELAEEYKKISGRDISVKGVIDTSDERTQVEKLSDEISMLYEEWKQINKKEIVDNNEIKKAKELKSQIKDLAWEYKQLTGTRLNIEGITEMPKVSKKAEVSFKRLNKKIRTVALSLFSLRTMYALLSRASSAYLTQDVELATKLQSVWLGLGSFLQPVLEGLANTMLKGIGYINEFVKALTGIDYIARANAKALEKQASAQGKVNKQLFSFDKINKLDEQTTSSSSSIKDGLQVEIPELNEKIVKKLQDLAYWLKENWDLLKALGELLILYFVGKKALEIIDGIGKIAKGLGLIKTGDAVTEVGKLGTALSGLPTAIAITISFITIYSTYKAIKDDIKEIDEWQETLKEHLGDIFEQCYSGMTDADDIFQEINTKSDILYETLNKSHGVWADIFGLEDEYLNSAYMNLDLQYRTLGTLEDQYKQGQLSNDEARKYLFSAMQTYNNFVALIPVLKKAGIDTSTLEGYASDLSDNIKLVGEDLGYSNEDLDEMLVRMSKNKDETKHMYDNLENINKLDLYSKDLTIDLDVDTSKAKASTNTFWENFKRNVSNILGIDDLKKSASVIKKLFGSAEGSIIGTKYLASGGIVGTPVASIVNAPNKGVYLGSGAIAGERGPEGVLPLTNEATMKKLGQEIGQWVTIGLNITNEIDGKVLNKRLETIKREGNFATNGGKL